MAVASALPATPVRGRPGWVAVVAFLVAGSIAGFAGRATQIEGTDIAALWPASGVVLAWFVVRRVTWRSVDSVLYFAAMLVAALATGIPTGDAFVLALAHWSQGVVAVELLRRALPELDDGYTTITRDAPRRLARYLASVGTGALVSTVVWISGWRLLGHEGSIFEASLWFGRNACGTVVVGTALLLLIRYLARPRPRPRLSSKGRLELLAASATSAVFYLLVFVADFHSMLFLLLGVGVWFGARFGTLINALHTFVVGQLAVLATLAGTGPFAQDEPRMNALLVQVFLLATAGTVLALSTGLEERRALHAELVQSTREMTYQAQLMDAVVSSMAEGLAVVDDCGRWLLRNPAATRVGGFAGDLRALLATSAGGDPLARALAGHTVRDVELRISDAPGAGRILAVSAAPLPRDSVTGRARALLIFRDATVEHARRIDLTAFAEVVAHDLRNPLAAVESWTEMMAVELGDGPVEAELFRDYVDRVGAGTRRMKVLIEDLLGRATHDSTLQLRRVDVTALAEEVAADHGATDHVKVGDIPDVLADAALVRQVLDNLLGNALKFVPAGDDPRISVTGRRTDSGTVAIAVADEGIGLPPGAHERIFDQHHRAHSSYDGRGLGLAICRRIVERHGGSITARDNAGRGAVFELTLPSPD